MRHLLSRLRSYFILDPLIWLYTVVLGSISLLSSLFDHSGKIQHSIAQLWARIRRSRRGSHSRRCGLLVFWYVVGWMRAAWEYRR